MNAVHAPDCVGLVLAAGAVSRYGGPKALAAGGHWLRTAVGALREGGCATVVVVLGATGPAIALPDGVQSIWAADWARGVRIAAGERVGA